MATPAPRDHRISLESAIGHTARFRAANPAPETEKAAMFWRNGGLDELLAQKGCAGLRIYYGVTDIGAPAPVLVGVDLEGNDLTAGTVLELHLPCPPYCPANSPLSGR
jgi:hypothetical protein